MQKAAELEIQGPEYALSMRRFRRTTMAAESAMAMKSGINFYKCARCDVARDVGGNNLEERNVKGKEWLDTFSKEVSINQ